MSLQLIRKFRISALFCVLAVLVCELISKPYAEMGVADDWSYIQTAQKFAATGHIIYSGWSSPLLGWQIYIGALFIKLFGPSLISVRMSTLLVALMLAFLLQRTSVRANIGERNATIGTLALVLSPLFLMLSTTYMTDMYGLFAVVICLYGCLRALQASTSRAAIAWICFAVATNAICGSARQIAWLGLLVMVPSTLYLFRHQRRILVAGSAAVLAGVLFIFVCMAWFQRQPYIMPEHIFIKTFSFAPIYWEFLHTALGFPFLLLPIVALFFPSIRKTSPVLTLGLVLVYLMLTVRPHHLHHVFMLEPTMGDWVGMYGIFEFVSLHGAPPIFLNTGVRVLLTLVSIGGLIGLIGLIFQSRGTRPPIEVSKGASRKQLVVLLLPFSVAHILLLIPRSVTGVLFDRYMLTLLVIAMLVLVRYYQDTVQPQIPFVGILLVVIMAIYGIAVTHNMFAFYRGRLAIVTELHAASVSDTAVDNGWEYNMGVELQHAGYINYPTILLPAHAYVPTPALPSGTCNMYWHNETPHIHPIYGISFDPNACYGPAPFAPVHYSRWLASAPGTLYVVKYLPPAKR